MAVARALVNHPPLLLADEPTGALDRAGRVEVLEAIAALREHYGTTVLLVSHDPVELPVDRVISMLDGRIAADERPGATPAAGRPPGPGA